MGACQGAADLGGVAGLDAEVEGVAGVALVGLVAVEALQEVSSMGLLVCAWDVACQGEEVWAPRGVAAPLVGVWGGVHLEVSCLEMLKGSQQVVSLACLHSKIAFKSLTCNLCA